MNNLLILIVLSGFIFIEYAHADSPSTADRIYELKQILLKEKKFQYWPTTSERVTSLSIGLTPKECSMLGGTIEWNPFLCKEQPYLICLNNNFWYCINELDKRE